MEESQKVMGSPDSTEFDGGNLVHRYILWPWFGGPTPTYLYYDQNSRLIGWGVNQAEAARMQHNYRSGAAAAAKALSTPAKKSYECKHKTNYKGEVESTNCKER